MNPQAEFRKLLDEALRTGESEKFLIRSWTKSDSKEDPSFRTLVKAWLDPQYRALAASVPTDAELLKAGFFDDGMEPSVKTFDVSRFLTPTFKLSKESSEKPKIALLSTGAFSPPHAGHLEMMHAAKKIVFDDYFVIGGYLSPSHDRYVSQKNGGEASCHFERRIRMCEEAVLDSDWLMVDPWESRYVECSINFSDVVLRLKAYLSEWLKEEVEIGYVFGADNYGFLDAFKTQGVAICCKRIGYEAEYERSAEENRTNPNAYFSEAAAFPISSSSVRKGAHNGLSTDKAGKPSQKIATIRHPAYLVRDDSEFAISAFPNKASKILTERIPKFKKRIFSLLEDFIPQTSNVVVIPLKSQKDILLSLPDPLVVLDVALEEFKGIPLSFTRKFGLCGGQISMLGFSPRFGKDSILEQAEAIGRGEFRIVDDDVSTGATMDFAESVLKKVGAVVLKRESLAKLHLESIGVDCDSAFDTVDLRDFVVGAKAGGLTVSLPSGGIGRSPYALPYVSPNYRASILDEKQVEFSLGIWKANLSLFEGLRIRIRDSDPGFLTFAESVGFSNNETIEDFCQAHIEILE